MEAARPVLYVSTSKEAATIPLLSDIFRLKTEGKQIKFLGIKCLFGFKTHMARQNNQKLVHQYIYKHR